MSNDYTQTLPPVPDLRQVPHGQLAACVVTYGHACAEAARAPLLARIAELEAENDSLAHQLNSSNERNGRLRAEVEALRKAGGTLATAVYNATGIVGPLNSVQRECLNNARIRWDAIAARKGAEGDRLGEGSE